MNLKEKTLCVVDHGHYQFIANKMAESYGKVYLYVPQEDSYLRPDKDSIGEGTDLIVVQDDIDFWKDLVFGGKADCFAFFDVGFGALQWTLQKLGKRVCGSLLSQKVEMDRWYLNECIKKVGLPTVPMIKVIGTTNLKAYLKKNPGKVIKISFYRGVVETFLSKDPWEMELQIIELDCQLGMNKDSLEFIVQDIIESDLEIGYDGFQIGALNPSNCMLGPEIKDKAYIGIVVEKQPPLIEYINKKTAPIFAAHGYQGFYSNELRLVEKPWHGFPVTPYYTDATCRAPSPPSEGQCEIYEPHCLARAVWDMSEGKVPILTPTAKYCVEIVLQSQWYDKHWLHVSYPKSINQWVKLKDYCIKNNERFCIPNGNGAYFGNVVAVGDKLQETINLVLKRTDQVCACEYEVHHDIFDGALKQMKLMKKFGLL